MRCMLRSLKRDSTAAQSWHSLLILLTSAHSMKCWHKLHFLVKKKINGIILPCYSLLNVSYFLKKSMQKKSLPVPDQCHLGNCNLSLCHSDETDQVLKALADSICTAVQHSKTQASPKQSIAFIIAGQEVCRSVYKLCFPFCASSYLVISSWCSSLLVSLVFFVSDLFLGFSGVSSLDICTVASLVDLPLAD